MAEGSCEANYPHGGSSWLRPVKGHTDNEKLAASLERHRDNLFLLLARPGLDATNYRARQAIRRAVVNRKIWRGAQSVLMSVLRTCHQQSLGMLDFLSRTHCDTTPLPLFS